MTAVPAASGSATEPSVPPDDTAGSSPPSATVPPADGPKDRLVSALEAWRTRLGGAGIVCRAVAFHNDDPQWILDFPPHESGLAETWAQLRSRVTADNSVALGKMDAGARSDLLMATLLQLPDGRAGIVGAVLAPPHNERTIQLVLLSLGWLQLALSAASLAHNQRAARLLELLGHVGSQHGARAAAQEWVNRTAAWARAEAPDAGGLALTLFEVRRDQVRWWVAADAAWAEKGSPAMQEAAEIATQAMVETRELRQSSWWAMPLFDDGELVAVLVARGEAAVPDEVASVLRASAGLSEPLLRHWRQADRSLWRHGADVLRAGWRKLSGPGHLTWKFAASGLLAVLAGLLLWPMSDRVTANLVIEGRIRQVMTAPFDGFVAKALVRPGDAVRRGQPLLRLDDRELKLEQAKYRSERDQAVGKHRQALAERDAPAVAIASAELRQAEAQLALVDAKLGRAELLSPLDGVVVSGDWVQQIGGPVETGKEMFEVAATDVYRVVLHVSDRDIARVRVGQRGALRLTGHPQASYGFRISAVTATASVQDGANGFRVEAAWDGSAPPLSPGMQGVGKIEVGEANLLTVSTRSSVDWLVLKIWSWWW